MGYCDEGCDHLTRRHNCNKYHKGLTYFGYSSKSLAYGSHERCSECDKDHYIAELEEKNNMSWIPVSERLPENVTEIVTEEEYIRQTKLVTDGEAVIMMIYENGEFRDIIDREKICDCVTAWMPLPQPYRPAELPAEGRGKR